MPAVHRPSGPHGVSRTLCCAATAVMVTLTAPLGTTNAAAQDVDASQMVRGGQQVVQMIDQGRLGELWDGASAVARKRVSRADFVRQVSEARTPLGAPMARTWLFVSRQAMGGSDPELAGQYVNVELETRFAAQPDKTVRELTTFHLGSDGVWRFSGYFLR